MQQIDTWVRENVCSFFTWPNISTLPCFQDWMVYTSTSYCLVSFSHGLDILALVSLKSLQASVLLLLLAKALLNKLRNSRCVLNPHLLFHWKLVALLWVHVHLYRDKFRTLLINFYENLNKSLLSGNRRFISPDTTGLVATFQLGQVNCHVSSL